MASVLAAAIVAIQFLFRTVAADWPSLTRALCRSVAGGACTPVVYRSALYEAGVAALGASAYAVPARVERMLRPPRPVSDAVSGFALAAVRPAAGR
jgi:hypothetical protein